MAALAFESAGRVRQKTFAHLWTSEVGTTTPSSAGVLYALKSFFMHLAANRGNPDLAWYPFANINTASTLIGSGAAEVYAVYGKKQATATDAYLHLFDDATDDAGTATDDRLVLPFIESGDVQFWIAPNGLTFGAGVVVASYTTAPGATDSATGDSANGFIIIGAA